MRSLLLELHNHRGAVYCRPQRSLSMKHLSISFLALAFVCAPAWSQQSAPRATPPDQAVYQSPDTIPPPVPPAPTSPATPANPQAVSSVGLSAPSLPGMNGPGTASQQGYDASFLGAPSPWQMETLRRRESPRQRGERMEVASRKNGVGTDASNSAWFAAWELRLVSIGVHPDKVKFEGRRLTKDEFAMWASRQVWATEANLIAP